MTDTKDSEGNLATEVYAEAEFYDLTFSVRKEEHKFDAETAEVSMAYALEGTEWSVGTVNVRTKRTWTSTEKNALSILRTVADLHGGDLKLANKGQDYEHLAEEIDEPRDKRQTLLVEDASLSGENERINELIEFIRKNKFRTLEYDDKLLRKIIQSVTVYEEHFVISFKSGIEIEI